MTPDPDGADFTEDVFLDGRVRLLQPRRGHRAGTDAVLLAGLSGARPGEHVVDAGSSTGAVGLMIAARATAVRLTLIDRDANLIAAARRNLIAGGLEFQGKAVCANLFGGGAALSAAGLEAGTADLVVTNPPFFDAGERASPHPGRRAAHHMEGGDLPAWLRACGWLLKGRGRVVLIHRADRLGSCLSGLQPLFGSPVVTPIYPRAGAPAGRVLIAARRGGRAPLAIAPPLVLHEADGTFTDALRRLNRVDG